jgi:hypothetical protein
VTCVPTSADSSGNSDLDADTARRLVDAWVADQTGTLDAAAVAALDRERPGWRAAAAQLIAEGLLAYVAVEMVAPDLAVAAAAGNPQHTDDAGLTARLGAHLRDFVDYRDEFDALRERLGQGQDHACDPGADHPGHTH